MSLAEAPAREFSIPSRLNAATVFVDRNVAEGRGARVAIHCGEREVTYAELLEQTNRLGNALCRLDVRLENRVFLLLLDSPEFAYSFFGAMKIGAVPIPINTLLTSADYEYLLNDSRAVVAIVSEALLPRLAEIPRDRLPHLRAMVVVGAAPAGCLSFERLLAAASPELEPADTSSDDTAFWLYSSGSTGFPKGCVHLHHDLLLCAEYYARGILGLNEADRTFSVAKLFFAYGLGNGLYFPFYVGASTVLFPGRPEVGALLEQVARFQPTLFFSVPTNYAAILASAAEAEFGSVRLAVSAGEALPAALFERFHRRFGVEILDGIGSTEVLHIFISNRPGQVRPGSSGQIVPGYEARVVDDDGQPTPLGEIGNLLIKGDSTCSQYWNRHHQSAQTILGEWIKTGDKYTQDADGYFWYAGRSDDMLKVGGIWVSPVEIEAVLAGHPAVLEAGVVGRADDDELIKPQAYVVLTAGVGAGPSLVQELQAYVKERLAPYKYPRWVEFVPELPKTATGKTQRFKLRELAEQAPK
jgi:benzoate-CoA ligase family protein